MPGRLRYLARAAFAGFLEDDCPQRAAAIAYYALLSIFPFLLAVTSVATHLLEQERVRAAIQEALGTYLPSRARAMVLENVDEAIRLRGPVGAVAVVAFLWSSAAAVGAVRHSLNRIWGVTRGRPFWRRKLVEVATTVVLGGILGALVVVSAGMKLLAEFGWRFALPGSSVGFPLAGVLRGVGTLAVVFLACLALYRVLPNRPLHWRWLWPGALVAAMLLEVTRQVAFWGLARFAQYQLVYGSMAGVIVFVLWMYTVALILLMAAEVSRGVAGSDSEPSPGFGVTASRSQDGVVVPRSPEDDQPRSARCRAARADCWSECGEDREE